MNNPVAIYNDNDQFVCGWLQNLMGAGLITEGVVDRRSILDLAPDDLAGYQRVHLCAGIGGWDLALQLAGWALDREVWTVSCPCQPFSVAGKGLGEADARHLWPVVFRLIAERRPATIFGEQVAAAVGKGWFTGVRRDLEGIGYAVGAGIIPACAVGAPHRRDRLWFVAERTTGHNAERRWSSQPSSVPTTRKSERAPGGPGGACDVGLADRTGRDTGQPAAEAARYGRAAVAAGGGVAHSSSTGLAQRQSQPGHDGPELAALERDGRDSDVEHDKSDGRREGWPQHDLRSGRAAAAIAGVPGYVGDAAQQQRHWTRPAGPRRRPEHPDTGGWDRYVWLVGADGKARRVGKQIRCKSYGLPGSMDGLRAAEEGTENVDGQTCDSNRAKAVRDMRRVDGAEAVQRKARGQDCLHETAAVLPSVCQRSSGSETQHLPQAGAQVPGNNMRGLRNTERLTRSPPGHGPLEQQPVKPSDVVWLVSSALALGEWQGSVEKTIGLQRLRKACVGAGVMLETFEAFPEAWRCASSATRERIGDLACQDGGLEWEVIPLLSVGEPARVGKLKGFGNAIVPQVAAAFIRAYMEIAE